MKVKVLKRNNQDFVRETKHDIHKVHRNYSKSEHPFEAEREYQRAMNSVKLERVFAKPLLGSLDGHRDGISCVTKHPTSISNIVSGAADGEVRIWDLSARKCTNSWQAHNGVVRGICFTPSGEQILSCADDKTIKLWSTFESSDTPLETLICKQMLMGISHSWSSHQFATCGESTQLWTVGRSLPVRTFQWGVESVHLVNFNSTQTDLLCAAASDNSIMIYDTRDIGPVRKVILTLRTNAVKWNPMEPMMFTAANEDYNLYSFDLRKLNRPVNVHMDHVAAVTDLDYSPTGREIASGSYDKTIRIFSTAEGRSREVYHTKRMQRLTNIIWSNDDKYIVSGSDEMCLRLWKARASEKLGILKDRERVALQYAEKLKEKYYFHPQVSRISRHRQVPKHIMNAQKELRVIRQSKKRKEANLRKHSKPGMVPHVAERDKNVVDEI